MNKIERLTSEILLLQERKRGSEELAELLSVSKRTIIRDVQALCEMGVPIIARDGAAGGYTLAGQYSIQPLQLTWKEALLLMLAMSGIAKLPDTPFSAERTSVLSKIRALLPAKHLDRVEGLLDKLTLEVPERSQRSPLLQQLVECLESDGWTLIRYRSDTEADFAVKPERIYADRGFWYMRARSDGQSRTYRVDRILRAEPCEPPVENESADLPYDHPSHPLIRVKLTRAGVRRVEQDPHIGPHLNSDGMDQVFEFRCPPSELDWYARYFGGMGGDAIVESPPALIAKIRARAREIFEIYGER